MSAEGVLPVYASGECELDLARRELRVHGSPVPLGGRAFEIIEVLARSGGALVTKDELMNRVWPGMAVMDNTLQVHAAAVRKALGPYRSLLKTESRRGYRLLGDWTVRRHDAATPPVGVQRMRVDGESPVTNFPATVTRLIGRSAAAARLRDLVSAYRIVTLTGPGGIGKTTLAMKVARRILGEFPDGGWLVELASLSDPSLVASEVAGVLGLGLASDTIVAETVAQAIGAKKLLLVLDNCEHLIGAVAILAEALLTHCPHITLLATSREILRIQGEHVYRVMSLEVPGRDDIEATEILRHSAPELFIARAAELGVDYASNARYTRAIAAICRRLDGIPLAIELAAARAAALGVDQVAAALRDRFDLLTSGRRTALPRHQTLRATLDWSYQLLNASERELLHRLAIFAGTFSLDAVCAVTGDRMTVSEIADGLAELVGKSLVIRAADPEAAEFRLLETTRIYALDRLTESGALPEVARRHAGYLLGLLGSLDEEHRSPTNDEYRAVLRRRADEIHVALEWAFSSAGDNGIGQALTLAAAPLWFGLSQMTVARARLEQALRHVEPGSDREMRLRVAMGHALWYSRPDDDTLEPMFARALQIAERSGATAIRTQTLWGLWASRRVRGDYPAALEMARRFADAAESAGDLATIHLADRILGLTHHYLGDQQTARDYAERALRRPHHLDYSLGLGYQIETSIAMPTLLARILWLQGFPDQAIARAAEAIAAARGRGHSLAIAYALTMAGIPVALWTGAAGEARRRVDLFIAHSVGHQRMEQWVPCLTRLTRLRQRDAAAGLIASYIEPRVDVVSATPLAHLAMEGNVSVPLPGEDPIDVLWNASELLRVDAELLLWHDAPGAASAAEAKLLRSLEIARVQAALSWELRAAMSLARLWWRQGKAAAARHLLAETYGKFTEGFGTSDLIRARGLMEDLAVDPPGA